MTAAETAHMTAVGTVHMTVTEAALIVTAPTAVRKAVRMIMTTMTEMYGNEAGTGFIFTVPRRCPDRRGLHGFRYSS